MTAPHPQGPLLVATGNPDKLRELREALPGVELEPLPPEVELPPEDGETFAANALTKARATWTASGRPAIADDSGIEAAALDGRPGVRSARYAGERASDEANTALLLTELAGSEDRRVAYVCALAYVDARGEWLFEGRCEGTAAEAPRGAGGFGYDPVFQLADGRTMAELTPEQKHAISHRGQAARQLGEWLAAQRQ